MGKIKIHEFDPDIYPMTLWVCLEAKHEELKEVFEVTPEETELKDAVEKNAATTCTVIRRSDNKHGVLVFTKKKQHMETHIIAHESVHVADAFFQRLSMMSQVFTDGNEPYAYLGGWAAKCINNAIKYKPNLPIKK